ncbi:MAG: archease [Polyangiaceae bacterium]|nr:archease [Polyangiaceae bacterium]
MTVVDVYSTRSGAEALVRCAVDLALHKGVSISGVSPLTWLNTPCGAVATLDVRGSALENADVMQLLGEVATWLEGGVAFREADVLPAFHPVSTLLCGFELESIDHTADEAFAVYARNRTDLFAAAAEAMGAMIVRPKDVSPAVKLPIDVAAPEPNWPDDDRLFAWLAEVLYTLEKERFALRRAVILHDDDNGIHGALFGEPMDETRHEVGGGIKAVTYHGMEIETLPDGKLRAQVIIDV